MTQLCAIAQFQGRHGYSYKQKAELISLLHSPRFIVLDTNGQENTQAQLWREKINI